MKLKPIVSALLALSLATGGGGVAFAQGDGDLAAQRQAQRTYQQLGQRGNVQQGQRGNQSGDRGNQHRDERGAGPDGRYHRGDRLPPEYRSHSYVVDDWRGHHLSAPPRGYHWVQNGGDYILVAITTGIILELLLNH
jgi:Ni/Co efflux regulator RcnB